VKKLGNGRNHKDIGLFLWKGGSEQAKRYSSIKEHYAIKKIEK